TTSQWPQSTGSVFGAQGHSLLFLSPKGREAGGLSGTVPAAALTIHPSLIADTDGASLAPAISATAPSVVNTTYSPDISVDTTPGWSVSGLSADGMKAPKAKHLLAQLAPDQLIAQGGANTVPPTRIPPVVTGTVDLEEFKSSNVIDLKVSQSRTFKLKN